MKPLRAMPTAGLRKGLLDLAVLLAAAMLRLLLWLDEDQALIV